MSKHTKPQSERQATSAAGQVPPGNPPPATVTPPALPLAMVNTSAIPAGAKRLNLPQIVKPDSVPVGACITSKLLECVDSPVTTVRGKVLLMQHEPSGVEFLFPCTGTIRKALAPTFVGDKDDDKSGDLLKATVNKYAGKTITLMRQPDGSSKTYGRSMFVFDVYVS